ncbi:MAG: hypothetical protein HY376_04290, partial [Candidatus Blackburnbacteria bacterium]|nr:hypothetical protein [Candidatus Blackburnbacteria bacterium]
MQYSVVKSSKIDLGDRIDAEYFEPSYLENESKLKRVNAEPLSKYVKLASSAFYPSATGYYEIGEMPFIRCVDCIDFPAITELQKEKFERLPHDFIEENKTIKKIKDGDIVITKVGSPCFASIIYGLGEVALSRTVLGAYKIKDIDPFYLIVFLRSKYGFDQLIRERELTIQYQLTLDRVGRILIYKPSNNFQKIIRQLFIKSQDLYINEIKLYQKAEELLLSELELLNWKPKHKLSFVKNYSDTEQSERFDAEYFQPFYEEVENELSKFEQKTLDEISSLINYGTVPTSPYVEQGIPYIKGLNLVDGFIGGSFDYLCNTEKLPKKFYVKENDIIISQMGTVGKAGLVSKNEENFLFASFTIRARLTNYDFIDPYVLTLFINIVARPYYLMRKIAQASVRQNTDLPTIKALKIPKLQSHLQKKIKDMIFESQKSRKLSKSLLEIAKRGVEMAIEKDEEEAEKWISSKLEKIKVIL